MRRELHYLHFHNCIKRGEKMIEILECKIWLLIDKRTLLWMIYCYACRKQNISDFCKFTSVIYYKSKYQLQN